MKFPAFTAVSLLMLALRVSGQDVVSDKVRLAERFAGCYELKVGHWWPWGFGEDGKLVTPPERIELLTKSGAVGFERGYFLIRALPNTHGRKGTSFWIIQSDSRLDLVWTDGFTGVSINLKKKGDVFRGEAHPHFDSISLMKHIAFVKMYRISCDTR